MVPKLTAALRKALRQLEVEKHRIDREIGGVRAALEALEGTGRKTPAASAQRKTSRRRMSLMARRAVSQRMKAYWAKRRAASTKSREKTAQKGE